MSTDHYGNKNLLIDRSLQSIPWKQPAAKNKLFDILIIYRSDRFTFILNHFGTKPSILQTVLGPSGLISSLPPFS